jgi:predicted AlkP superfamily phosphohydrolase/phosphomutase
VKHACLVALSIFVTACAGPRTPQYHQKLVVLGIDGLDPDLVSRFIAEGKLPNMQRLSRQGALQRLETTPSAGASAWASFATGTNPGKHGVFGDDASATRHGAPFWTLAGQAGVRSSVLMVPLTFPPADVPDGELLSGWPAPDLRGTPGRATYFSTAVAQNDDVAGVGGAAQQRLRFDGDIAKGVLAGPEGLTLPVSIFWNRAGKAATIDVDGSSVRLDEGEWSKWIPVDFSRSIFSHRRGMVQFALVRAATTFALYASPVNITPDRPAVPLSSPPRLSSDISERVGPYHTLGWAEATAALDAGLIDEKLFMDDVYRAFDDRAQVILQRIDTKKWDLLVGDIDSVDHVQHVMWRLTDPSHPAYDRAIAAKFGDAVEHLYRRSDDFLGEVVKHAGDGTAVLLVSAYGERGVTQTFDLRRWLAQEHLPGTVTVTSSGGLVLSPEARGVQAHLIARLTAVLDPATRMPVVDAGYAREAVYSGPYVADAPDVQLGLAPGYGIGAAPSLLAPNRRRWSADHAAIDYRSVPGVLISNRPTSTDGPRVIDIAPTVLRYFGVPIPTEIDGTPLF